MTTATTPAEITWASRYRAAALELQRLQAAATDDLVKEALGDAAAKYVIAMLEHEEIYAANRKRAAA